MSDSDPTLPDPGRPGTGTDALPDRFEVVRLLGAGGMGVVYLARDTALAREVAVKKLSLEATAPLRARLLREAQAVARLDHPNVVRVHDVLEDTLCIVMEYVHGRSLAVVTEERGRLPPDEVRRIGEEVLEALAAAHEVGIIHRDVKPANVLLGPTGAKLSDFGIARVEGSNLTLDSDSVGTPAYMAPEQQEDPTGVDHRADLYSLGVVLYEIACGRRPTTSEGRDPDPERTVRRETGDPGLAAVIARALAPRRDDRWPSAREMLAGMRRTHRRRGRVAVAVALLVLVSLPILYLVVRGDGTGRATREPGTALGEALVAPDEEPTIRSFAEAHAAFREGRGSAAREALEHIVAEEPSNGLAWYELAITRWWDDERRALVDEVLTRGLAAPIDEKYRLILGAFREVARSEEGPAVAVLREAAPSIRDSFEARYLLGELLFHTFRTREAIEQLERVVEEAPAFGLAAHHVLHYDLAHGRFDRAERLVARARRSQPDSPARRQQEALVLAARGDFGRAIEIAEELAASGEPSGSQFLGAVLDHAGETDRARSVLERCAAGPHGSFRCARYLAAIAASSGRASEVDRWLAVPSVGVPPHDKERDAAEVALLLALLGRTEPAKRELAAAGALVEGGEKVARDYLFARLLVAYVAGEPIPEPAGRPPDPLEAALRAALAALREDRPAEAARRLSEARAEVDDTRFLALLRAIEARAWAAAGNGEKAALACEEVVRPPVWSMYRAADLGDCRRRLIR